MLVDQRTGRHIELVGTPVASSDGRLVLLTSPGLGGGDQPNMLSLVQVEATGPRLLWRLEPTAWEPVEARWLAPRRVVLMRRHALPDGSMADDAPVTYDELTLPPTRWLLAAALLCSACRPDPPQEEETPPRLKPLLDTLPVRYRSFDRQDTLDSYWAPDSLMTDSLFHFTEAHRSRVLLRVQFVPASAVAAARLDTLTFRRPTFLLYEDSRRGYEWEFFFGSNLEPTLTETPDGVPLHMGLTYSPRLALQEYRRWPAGNYYERNAYLLDHNFGVETVARVSDSVVYVRAFPLLADQPRPDTLYTYYHGGPHRKRIPLVADRPDTTRHALLRLSFRLLSHSANSE